MESGIKKAGKKLKRSCCVPKCDAFAHSGNNISFHNFPSEPKQCKNWRVILGIKEPIDSSMVVCSQHFSEDAFYYETTNINERSLKDGAIPSRNLPHKVLKLSKDEYQAFKKKYIETSQNNTKLMLPENMVNKLMGKVPHMSSLNPVNTKTLESTLSSIEHIKLDQNPTASKGRVRKNENSQTTHLASRSSSFNGTNGSALKAQRNERKVTAHNVTLQETPIDNKVVRVTLKKSDLNDLQQQYKLWSESKTSRSGRKIKRKHLLPGFDFSLPKLGNHKDFEKFVFNNTSTPKTNPSQSVSRKTVKRKLSECLALDEEDPLEIRDSDKNNFASESKIRKVESTKINGALKGQDQRRDDIGKQGTIQLKREFLTKKQEEKTLNKVIQKSIDKKKKPVTCLKSIRLVKREGETFQVKITPSIKRKKDLAKASPGQTDHPKFNAARRNPLNKLSNLKEARPIVVSSPSSNTKNKILKFKVTSTPKVSPSLLQKRNGHMPVHQEILYVRQPSNTLGYYLKMPNYRHPGDGKLKYKFQTLVSDMRTLKLPSPSWKIKVIVRQNNVSGVTVTNKADLERSLSFYADRNDYCIKIDNKFAYLLGSPGELCSKNDIEILLDIIEGIDPKNPMIMFK